VKCLVAALVAAGLASSAHADAVDTGDGLPDPTARLLRWPLSASEHPELAPRYAVAKDLAEPGLDWIELCKMGAHKRTVPSVRDQTAYLGAWCAIANRDFDAGIASLQLLASSRVRGMPAAIRADLANVLASESDRATALIQKHKIKDVVVIDRAVALFVDMNKLVVADELNDLAIGAGDRVLGSCERQARRVVMNPDAYRVPGIDRRRLLRGKACDDLEAEIGCWLDITRCGAFYKDQGRTKLVAVFDAFHRVGLVEDDMREALDDLTTEADLFVALSMATRLMRSQPCTQNHRSKARWIVWTIQWRDAAKVPKAIKERADAMLDHELDEICKL
jgi:hypothetical protein